MILKSLICLLLVSLIVSATNENQWHKTICEKQLPDKCSSRTIRSIISPITNIIENVRNKLFKKNKSLLNDNETIINCKNELVLEITKASISNIDKTKCAINGVINENKTCSDIIMTTILTEKLCNGKTECQLTLEKYYSSFCECSTQKYLDVSYKCVKPFETKELIKDVQKRSPRVNYNLLKNVTNTDDKETPLQYRINYNMKQGKANNNKKRSRKNKSKNKKKYDNHEKKTYYIPERYSDNNYENDKDETRKYRPDYYKDDHAENSEHYDKGVYEDEKKDYSKKSKKYRKNRRYNNRHKYDSHDDSDTKDDYNYDDYYNDDYYYDDYYYDGDYYDGDYYGGDYYGGDYYYDDYYYDDYYYYY